MSKASDFLEVELLDHTLGEGARNFTPSSSLFIALSTAAITDAHTGSTFTEMGNTNGYQRQAVTFNAASSGSATNSIDVTFTAVGGAWSTATGWCVVTSQTYGAGDLYFYDNDMSNFTLGTGDSTTFAADTGLTISAD